MVVDYRSDHERQKKQKNGDGWREDYPIRSAPFNCVENVIIPTYQRLSPCLVGQKQQDVMRTLIRMHAKNSHKIAKNLFFPSFSIYSHVEFRWIFKRDSKALISKLLTRASWRQ